MLNKIAPTRPSSLDQSLKKRSIGLLWRIFLNALFFFFCFIIAFYFSSALYKILQLPFNDVMHSYDTIIAKKPILPEKGMMPKNGMLIVSSPTESFLIYAKIALFAASVITLPLLLAQFYSYKMQGYGVKRRYSLLAFYFAGLCLSLFGLGVGYYLFVPLGLQVLASQLPAEVFWRSRQMLFSSHVLDNEMVGLLATGLLFQFPLFLWVLAQADKKR